MSTLDSYKWFLLAGLLVTGWLLYLLAPILSPFMFAALLAYLGDPLVDKLEARKLSRMAIGHYRLHADVQCGGNSPVDVVTCY